MERRSGPVSRRHRKVARRRHLLALVAAVLPSASLAQSAPTSVGSDPFLTTFQLGSSSSSFFNVAAPPSGEVETFVTLNLCSPPGPPGPSFPYTFTDVLVVSNVSSAQTPSPQDPPSKSHGARSDTQGGFANVTLFNSQGLFIGVYAPPGGGDWTVQLGVSTETALHRVNAYPAFRFEDADASSALLTAADTSLFIPSDGTAAPALTQMFPLVLPTTPNLPLGLTASLCAVQAFLNSSSTDPTIPLANVNVSLTTRNLGIGQPSASKGPDNDYRLSAEEAGQRAQYLLEGLETGTNYTAWMFEPAGPANGSIDGQWTGRLWPAVNFGTKSTESCRLVHDLSFCPSVAYSIPSPSLLPTEALVAFYESLVSPHLSNFALTMSTFPCRGSPGTATDGTYSYVATCSDCVSAYTDWVCSVLLPRCTDAPPPNADLLNPSFADDPDVRRDGSGDQLVLSSPIPQIPQTVLVRDNATLSRTPFLVESNLTTCFPTLDPSRELGRSPFPYGEVPPCIDLCYYVAATCPPFLGWKCPLTAKQSAASITTLAASYGVTVPVLSPLEIQGGGDVLIGWGEKGGGSAGDRFGNVWCNALGTDLTYARMTNSAGSRGVNKAMVIGWTSVVVGLVACI